MIIRYLIVKYILLFLPILMNEQNTSQTLISTFKYQYSLNNTNIIYVDKNASGNNDGSSWINAITNIQDAVNVVKSGGEVRIAAGIYKQGIEVNITKVVTLKGGYPTGGGIQDIVNNVTILDGENSYRVLKYDMDANQTIEGLIIQNGFSNNDLGGAGILIKNAISTKTFNLNKVKLLNNQITGGDGGAGIFSTHNLIFTTCEIRNNNASSGSGGIHSLSNITATDTKITNNTGVLGGGLYSIRDVELVDVLVANNTATDIGGGVYAGQKIHLLNATVVKNNAINSAGGVSLSSADRLIKNSIIALNTAPTFPQENLGNFNPNNSNPNFLYFHNYIQDTHYAGPGNIDDRAGTFNPLFVDVANGDFNLQDTSPLVNVGTDNRGGIDVDVNGNPRTIFCTIDIGAFENIFQRVATTIYVDKTATGTNNGSSWIDAFTTLTAAINYSSCIENDEIRIAAGTYQEGEYVFNVTKTIKGGYPNGGGLQDVINNSTILDGNNSYRVFNTAHTIGTTYLEGLTIQNGSVTNQGGGIRSIGNIELNQIIVKNNTVSSSIPLLEGGGIYCSGGNLTLINSTVKNNTLISTSSTLNSGAIGGGIYSNNAIFLTNSKVNNNNVSSSFTDAYGGGAGIFNRDNVILLNSEVNNNESSFNLASGGGGIASTNNITLINSQVNKNTSNSSNSFSRAGGIFVASGAIITLQNSILWGNTKTEGSTTILSEYEGSTLIFNHSLIKDQYPTGVNNIDATVSGFNPLFVDEAGGNYRLQSDSPLINVGNNTFNSTTEDLDGNTRFVNAIDIGPYEYQITLSSTDITEYNMFNLFPNPTSNYIIIDSDIVINEVVEIFNLAGQRVLQTKIINFSNKRIDVTLLSKGMYLIKINNKILRFIKN